MALGYIEDLLETVKKNFCDKFAAKVLQDFHKMESVSFDDMFHAINNKLEEVTFSDGSLEDVVSQLLFVLISFFFAALFSTQDQEAKKAPRTFPSKKENPKDTEKSQKKKKKEIEEAAVAAASATSTAAGTSDEEASGPDSTPQSPVTPQLTPAQIAAKVRQATSKKPSQTDLQPASFVDLFTPFSR